MLDIRKVAMQTPYRVICIADIHGNYTAFTRLLEKVNYNKDEDYLFILGDLLERGQDEELPMIDCLYELSKNEKVHIIFGNNDRRMRFLQNEDCAQCLDWLKARPKNIFAQWATTIGVNDTDITEENYSEVVAAIKQKYQDKIDLVINLPLVLETDEFICVHWALDSREDWWETAEWDAVYYGDITAPNKTGKWIISGHYPVMFLSQTQISANPIIRDENKTVSIDGGASFPAGQLNAFIIEKAGANIVFSHEWADKYPQSIITETIESDYINAVPDTGDKNIKVIKKGEYFTECKVIDTGAKGLIKNEYIEGKGNEFTYWNSMANFVSVYENEIVSVIDDTCDGYTYIRNSKGELGWIAKESIKK